MAIERPAKFAHVVYRTRRWQAMLDWYALVFGATVRHEDGVLAFLTFDDEHHRFAIANLDVIKPGGGADERGMVGVDHVAWTYPSLAGMLDNWERLKAQGVEPYWAVHHGITASLYYADPDGNQMEFQVEALDAEEDASAWMAAHFPDNPVGVEFDPAAWHAALQDGATERDLLHEMPAGEVSPIRGALA